MKDSSTAVDLTYPQTEPIRHIEDLDNPRQVEFLAKYVEYGTLGRAGAASGVNPMTHWKWMNGYRGNPPDSLYIQAWAIAQKMAAEQAKDEVYERAVHIKKPSDLLLMFHVKSKCPEYRDNFQVNVDNRKMVINVDKGQFNFDRYRGMLANQTALVEKDNKAE